MSEQSDLLSEQPSKSGGALVILPLAELPTILQADDKDILKGLLRELEGWEPDASTPKGREVIRGKGQKIRIAKADFGRLADKLKEDALKTQKSVNAEFKILEQRMNELLERVRGPLTEYEGREKRRVEIHESRIKTLEEYSAEYATSSEIAKDIDVYTVLYAEEDFEEFAARAHKARTNTLNALRVAYQAAKTREDEAAAQAQRDAEEAEWRRMEAAEAQRVREEQIARDAAEAARVAAEAEAQAAMRAHEEAARLEREVARRREVEAQEALARAESERLAGIEREGVAKEKAEAERIRRHESALESIQGMVSDACSPFNGSDMIRNIVKIMDGMAEMKRDWQEYTERFKETMTLGRKRIADRLTVVEGHEAERREKQRREEKLAAEQKAVADKHAGIEAERARVAKAEAAQRAEDEKRAANVAHQRKINGEAATDIEKIIAALGIVPAVPDAPVSPTMLLARAIVVAVAKNTVRNLKVAY